MLFYKKVGAVCLLQLELVRGQPGSLGQMVLLSPPPDSKPLRAALMETGAQSLTNPCDGAGSTGVFAGIRGCRNAEENSPHASPCMWVLVREIHPL